MQTLKRKKALCDLELGMFIKAGGCSNALSRMYTLESTGFDHLVKCKAFAGLNADMCFCICPLNRALF